jgi:hypothetical protein
MKTAVFWFVARCILGDELLCDGGVSTSETSVNFYQTTWRNNSEVRQPSSMLRWFVVRHEAAEIFEQERVRI